jgi:hypothetical protein
MDIQQRRLVGGAIGGLAYYNGWNGIQWNGVKHVVSLCSMCLIPFYGFHSSHYNETILLLLLSPVLSDAQLHHF